MIGPKLRNIIDELRREADCECYVVLELTAGEAMVLMVPHGAEGEMTVNPIGSRAGTRRLSDDDWGRITKPMLMVMSDEMASAPRPRLRAVCEFP